MLGYELGFNLEFGQWFDAGVWTRVGFALRGMIRVSLRSRNVGLGSDSRKPLTWRLVEAS